MAKNKKTTDKNFTSDDRVGFLKDVEFTIELVKMALDRQESMASLVANVVMEKFGTALCSAMYHYIPLLPLGTELRGGVVTEVTLKRGKVGLVADFYYKVSSGTSSDDWVEVAQSDLEEKELDRLIEKLCSDSLQRRQQQQGDQ